jgi:hypothetical protein
LVSPIFTLTLAGVLTLGGAHAAPLVYCPGPAAAGPAADIVQVRDGDGLGWYAPPYGPAARRQARGLTQERRDGRGAQYSGLSGPPGRWGAYRGPTYWVWGPSGGAFDYPLQIGEARTEAGVILSYEAWETGN